MKVRRLYESPKVRILLVAVAILCTLGVGSAGAASEPGTVSIVVPNEPSSLEPGESCKGNVSRVLVKNILEALTEINFDNGSVMPRLATSWKQVDANTWQFSLRKGVKFHDGQDFNAQAFLFNIKRIYDKKLVSNVRDKFFSSFKMDVKALDSHSVEIKTDTLQPLLPTLISYLSICSPNTPLDKWTRTPIGTGPYKFTKWDPGMQVVMERFDGYWGKKPQVKKAIYVWRTESAVRAAMALTGEVDLAADIAKQDATRPNMDISYLSSETAWIHIGGEWEPPLNDKRVRLALNYAVDRDAIRGSILGKDVIPASQVIVPSIVGYNPDLKVYPYDPKKAKQLLDEARKDGVPIDKEMPMIVRGGYFAGCEELAEAMMTMYKAVGLNVTLKVLEPGVYVRYRNIPFPPGPYLFQHSIDNNNGDPAFMTFYNFHSKGRASSTRDKKVDELIEKAQVAPMGEERKKLWQAAYKAIDDAVPQVALFHLVAYVRVGNRISFKPNMGTVNEIAAEQITLK